MCSAYEILIAQANIYIKESFVSVVIGMFWHDNPRNKEIDVNFRRTSGYNTTPNLALYRAKCRNLTSANAETE